MNWGGIRAPCCQDSPLGLWRRVFDLGSHISIHSYGSGQLAILSALNPPTGGDGPPHCTLIFYLQRGVSLAVWEMLASASLQRLYPTLLVLFPVSVHKAWCSGAKSWGCGGCLSVPLLSIPASPCTHSPLCVPVCGAPPRFHPPSPLDKAAFSPLSISVPSWGLICPPPGQAKGPWHRLVLRGSQALGSTSWGGWAPHTPSWPCVCFQEPEVSAVGSYLPVDTQHRAGSGKAASMPRLTVDPQVKSARCAP